MVNAILVAFCFLCWTDVQGQSNKVHILNAADSASLMGVHILDLKGDLNRVSNEDGLIDRPQKKGRWKVSHIGYQSQFINEWEDIDSLFLQARRFELETVEVYGFDLIDYLKQSISKTRTAHQGELSSDPMLLRKRATTNGKITQLYQIQIQANENKELLLCGIDYAAESDLKTSLKAGGYIESDYLLDQLKVNYPATYLLKYLVRHEVTEVKVDSETVNISFKGSLSDSMQAEMELEEGKLIFGLPDRQLMHLEWVSRPKIRFRSDYSKRYKKRYALAIRRNYNAWNFDRNQAGHQRLKEFNTSVNLLVRVKKDIDEVVLNNQVIGGLPLNSSLKCQKMDTGKALIDQLNEVSPSHSNFLLSEAEKKFLINNGNVN